MRVRLGLTMLVVLGLSVPARAHPAPSSLVLIDLTVDGARIEQDVPLVELELALHQKLARGEEDPSLAVQRARSLLVDYATAHVRGVSREGAQPWQVTVRNVRGRRADDGPRVTFDIVMRAPSDEGATALMLTDEIVTHEVVSHYATVYLRSDWSSHEAAASRLLGTMHAGRNVVTVSRSGSLWQGFQRIVELGAEHIAEGTDHLLFLFALVLVAPLVAAGSRWELRPTTSATLGQLLRVVSAFTVGHSLTLALGAVGGLSLPANLVEIGIALSVLLAAGNVLLPIFAGRETLLALVFGLVHGLAFASTIADECLGRVQTVFTLLGFNLGIEFAQLGLLGVVVPWLLLLARTRAYPRFRVAGGTLIAVFAVGWLVERINDSANPLAPLVGWLEERPAALLVALAAGTMLARTLELRPRNVAPGSAVANARAGESKPISSEQG